MGKFMDSPLVQEQLEKIDKLQEEIFSRIVGNYNPSNKDKAEQYEKLLELLELQASMYTRMSLSDDPDAEERKEAIQEFVQMMGFGRGRDVLQVFQDMREQLEEMRTELLDD